MLQWSSDGGFLSMTRRIITVSICGVVVAFETISELVRGQ